MPAIFDASLLRCQVFIGPVSAVFDTKDSSQLLVVDSDPEAPENGGAIRKLDVTSGAVTTIIPKSRGFKDGELDINFRGLSSSCHWIET